MDGDRETEFRAERSAADRSANERASCVPTEPFLPITGGRIESSCVGGGGG
jgi:hypothetical protein